MLAAVSAHVEKPPFTLPTPCQRRTASPPSTVGGSSSGSTMFAAGVLPFTCTICRYFFASFTSAPPFTVLPLLRARQPFYIPTSKWANDTLSGANDSCLWRCCSGPCELDDALLHHRRRLRTRADGQGSLSVLFVKNLAVMAPTSTYSFKEHQVRVSPCGHGGRW